MKRFVLLSVIGVFCAMFGATASLAAVPVQVELTKIEGDVQVMLPGSSAWKPAASGTMAPGGTKIKTGPKAKVTLLWSKENAMSLGAFTNFTIKKVEIDPRNKSVESSLDLGTGKIKAKAEKLTSPSSSFTVSTPTAVAGVRGTTFGMENSADNTTTIQTFEGLVVMTPQGGGDETPVTPGNKGTLKEGETEPTVEEMSDEENAEFEEFEEEAKDAAGGQCVENGQECGADSECCSERCHTNGKCVGPQDETEEEETASEDEEEEEAEEMFASITAPADGESFPKGAVEVSVSTLAGAQCSIGSASVTAGSDGSAAATLDLQDGENEVSVSCASSDGQTAGASVSVIVDSTGPAAVSVTAPQDGFVPGIQNGQLCVGLNLMTEEGATVTVNGVDVSDVMQPGGSIVIPCFPLAGATQKLTIEAQDSFGRSSVTTVSPGVASAEDFGIEVLGSSLYLSPRPAGDAYEVTVKAVVELNQPIPTGMGVEFVGSDGKVQAALLTALDSRSRTEAEAQIQEGDRRGRQTSSGTYIGVATVIFRIGPINDFSVSLRFAGTGQDGQTSGGQAKSSTISLSKEGLATCSTLDYFKDCDKDGVVNGDDCDANSAAVNYTKSDSRCASAQETCRLDSFLADCDKDGVLNGNDCNPMIACSVSKGVGPCNAASGAAKDVLDRLDNPACGLSCNATLNPEADCDKDGLDNATEGAFGTNPYKKDSDADGFTDDVEIASFTDPLDDRSYPGAAGSDTGGTVTGNADGGIVCEGGQVEVEGACYCPAGTSLQPLDPSDPDSPEYCQIESRSQCPSDKPYYDDLAGGCVAACIGGQVGDYSTQSCYCESGYKDYNELKCIDACPFPLFPDPATGECRCPANEPLFDPFTGLCAAACSGGQVGDPAMGGCFCPDGTRPDYQKSGCVQTLSETLCPLGTVAEFCDYGQLNVDCDWDGVNNGDESVAGTDPCFPELEDPGQGFLCPEGTAGAGCDVSDRSADCDYDGAANDQDPCACDYGTPWDSYCPPPPTDCPEGYVLDEFRGGCVPAGSGCHGGAVETSDGECVCPEGTWADASLGGCVAGGSDCPEGLVPDLDGLCVADSSKPFLDPLAGWVYVAECSGGQIGDYASGYCLCPAGTTLDYEANGCVDLSADFCASAPLPANCGCSVDGECESGFCDPVYGVCRFIDKTCNGDGVCEPWNGENAGSCQTDCYCGDGYCDETEAAGLCGSDCGEAFLCPFDSNAPGCDLHSSSTPDCDGDGTDNLSDSCPCLYGDSAAGGCPACAQAGSACDPGAAYPCCDPYDTCSVTPDGSQPICHLYYENDCQDGADNDFDGAADCQDYDCSYDPACAGGEAGLCDDGVDNDQNGLTDCVDEASCYWDPACNETGYCADGIDNDGNGTTDCADANCSYNDPACNEYYKCADGIDNDGDGFSDCADSDCAYSDEACNEYGECVDGTDNDGDALVDCDDEDCAYDDACLVCNYDNVCDPGEEGGRCPDCGGGEPYENYHCDDGIDNDADGLADCDDFDCYSNVACGGEAGACMDATDNDADGSTDCADTDCAGQPECGVYGEYGFCTDGLDNDSDGYSDCDDSDCDFDPGCTPPYEVNCEDGLDDDSDGLTDCDDMDCEGYYTCPVQESGYQCEDMTDNDSDGLTDCDDEGCFPHVTCGGEHGACKDQTDNDSDGWTDCDDPDCGMDPDCTTPPYEYGMCVDGIDNDLDGLVDCDDVDCEGEINCGGGMFEDVCDDLSDNDSDGLTDCDDPDCTQRLACGGEGGACEDMTDNDSDGWTDCEDPDCGFDPVCAPAGEAGLCDDGYDNDFDGPADCNDADCYAIDPFCGTGMDEVGLCDNGINDDSEGGADCDDFDCFSDPFCSGGMFEDVCDDVFDNDDDGFTDCDDDNCYGSLACGGEGGACADFFDDDDDGLTDCDDEDCSGSLACGGEGGACADLTDNDLDGLADCDDPDCYGDPVCSGGGFEDLCDDLYDNDSDGWTDCDDADCYGHPACSGGGYEDICDDLSDNDSDGLTDCADVDCEGHPLCSGVETNYCDDLADNDNDGLADCDDSDCSSLPMCSGTEVGYCSDSSDNDGDGPYDCADSDCYGTEQCVTELNYCGDLADNDADGLTDCADSDCAGSVGCGGEYPECQTGIDEDSDGLMDCADPDCDADFNCSFEGYWCGDMEDNDNDGLFDCDDEDCFSNVACAPTSEAGLCTDVYDNDMDGPGDCYDIDCLGDPACTNLPGGAECSDNSMCESGSCPSGTCAYMDEIGLCGDTLDNDSDGQADCLDSDCTTDVNCGGEGGACADLTDNDSDGFTDCDDSDCQMDPSCAPPSEYPNCSDSTDNDSDGLTDCLDSDCSYDPACNEYGFCADTVDNDNDTFADCADSDCSSDPACAPTDEIGMCADTVDNDGDSFTDCADSDCIGDPACVETACMDSVDNDLDYYTDCADSDCSVEPICMESNYCADMTDNDVDGQTDCADSDCYGVDPVCIESGNCSDSVDNDLDYATDCADSECQSDPACPELACTDGMDNDLDAAVDCDDSDCYSDPGCNGLGMSCSYDYECIGPVNCGTDFLCGGVSAACTSNADCDSGASLVCDTVSTFLCGI